MAEVNDVRAFARVLLGCLCLGILRSHRTGNVLALVSAGNIGHIGSDSTVNLPLIQTLSLGVETSPSRFAHSRIGLSVIGSSQLGTGSCRRWLRGLLCDQVRRPDSTPLQ